MPRRSINERIRYATASGDIKTLSRLATTSDLISNHDPTTGRANIAVAVDNGQTETCKWLWKNGSLTSEARLSSQDPDVPGGTIVHLATLRNHKETLIALLEHFPQFIDWPDDAGQSPVHIAARCGHLGALQILLEPGRDPPADVDLPDNRGDTPLHLASAWGRLQILAPLIQTYKASYLTKNLAGFSPGDIAYDVHTAEVVKTLVRSKTEDRRKTRRPNTHSATSRR